MTGGTVTPDQIRALAADVRRYTPGARPAEVAAYARRYKGWAVTDDEVRAALTTR
ncbi:hypothetical protein ACIP29_37565 [Streptomyces coelicoflavus]|uniref:hypothetical protein n=1 Tax=Bacteria TaxID=2 RepID=UPI0038268BEB